MQYTINELINQDYANDKERALCEYILKIQGQLSELKKDLTSIYQEQLPPFYPIEYGIESLQCSLGNCDLTEKAKGEFDKLVKDSANYDKERERAYNLLDDKLAELKDITDEF